ncbi:MAG: amidase [Hyphomicrobiales bacterium]
MGKDLAWASAAKLAKGYRKKRFSPVEATEAVLARIAALNGELNAFNVVDAEGARAAAKASERRWLKGEPKGLLDGVPVSVKDLILWAGHPTLRGSRTIDPAQAVAVDAPSVARLKDHGAVIVGKTTTPEFGWKGVTDSPLTGITRNPWDLTKTPGGSSGGASAAVAAGMAPLALGTDGGGSIRIPAAFSGIVGHKPSFGRVPAWPPSPFASVAHVGPMTRTVEDAALLLTVLSEPDPRDWFALPYEARDYTQGLTKGIEGFRVAFAPTFGGAEVDPEIGRLVRQAVKVLKDLGAKVEETDPGLGNPVDTFRTIWWSGVRALLGAMPAEKRALVDPDLQDVYRQAQAFTIDDLQAALIRRAEYGSKIRQFMAGFDLLVTPTLPIPAFEVGMVAPKVDGTGKWVDWTPFTYPFNLTLQPACSVPCGFTKAGLPAGLQIVGRMYDDVSVLRAAYAYEQAQPWRKMHPPLAMKAAKAEKTPEPA